VHLKKKNSLFISTVIRLIETWSNKNCVRNCPLEKHSYITQAILYSLEKLSKNQIEVCDILSMLVTGVQVRMESSITMIRHWGMRVGEKFSVIIDPKNPLKFEYEIDIEPDTYLLEQEKLENIKQEKIKKKRRRKT